MPVFKDMIGLLVPLLEDIIRITRNWVAGDNDRSRGLFGLCEGSFVPGFERERCAVQQKGHVFRHVGTGQSTISDST